MLQVHLVPSLPWPWNQLFLQEAPVPFSGEQHLEIKMEILGMLIAVGMSLLPGNEHGLKIYVMYIYISSHMHLRTAIFTSISNY